MFYENYWNEKPNDELNDFVYKWPVIKKVFPRINRLKVLDYGCGSGRLLGELINNFPDNSYIGADVSESGLKRAKRNLGEVEFAKVSDGVKLPFGKNSFDLIIATDVIEHVYDTKLLFSEFYRILRMGGEIIITIPYHGLIKNILICLAGFEEVFDPTGPHIRFFTKRSLNKCLSQAGLIQVYITTFGRFYPLSRGLLSIAKK